MKNNNRIYAIIQTADLPLIDFSQIVENDKTTIRKSYDGLKFLIKYNSEPSFIIDGSVVPLEVLTYSEALTLMNTIEWQIPMSVD
tara:strand:- start:192 stop:446 length:255 start_codon:yes stop_codon:yes gene_type:complete